MTPSAPDPQSGLPEPGLRAAYRELAAKTVRTDLTHAFPPGQPHFAGFPDEDRETLFDTERGDGFTVHRHTLVGSGAPMSTRPRTSWPAGAPWT